MNQFQLFVSQFDLSQLREFVFVTLTFAPVSVGMLEFVEGPPPPPHPANTKDIPASNPTNTFMPIIQKYFQ